MRKFEIVSGGAIDNGSTGTNVALNIVRNLPAQNVRKVFLPDVFKRALILGLYYIYNKWICTFAIPWQQICWRRRWGHGTTPEYVTALHITKVFPGIGTDITLAEKAKSALLENGTEVSGGSIFDSITADANDVYVIFVDLSPSLISRKRASSETAARNLGLRTYGNQCVTNAAHGASACRSMVPSRTGASRELIDVFRRDRYRQRSIPSTLFRTRTNVVFPFPADSQFVCNIYIINENAYAHDSLCS